MSDSDIAAGVSADVKATLVTEWLDSVAKDPTVQTVHLLASSIVEQSLLTTKADADAESARRQSIRGVVSPPVTLVLPMDSETIAVDIGDVISVTNSRFGLSSGKFAVVMKVDSDAEKGELTWLARAA
jgi:hypothetical protein